MILQRHDHQHVFQPPLHKDLETLTDLNTHADIPVEGEKIDYEIQEINHPPTSVELKKLQEGVV